MQTLIPRHWFESAMPVVAIRCATCNLGQLKQEGPPSMQTLIPRQWFKSAMPVVAITVCYVQLWPIEISKALLPYRHSFLRTDLKAKCLLSRCATCNPGQLKQKRPSFHTETHSYALIWKRNACGCYHGVLCAILANWNKKALLSKRTCGSGQLWLHTDNHSQALFPNHKCGFGYFSLQASIIPEHTVCGWLPGCVGGPVKERCTS